LLNLTDARAQSEYRLLEIQIAKDLAGQLSRALGTNDDLAALASLRDARTNHPQLREAMIFDNTGRILLHTDSGMMGRTVAAPQGPRLSSPELTSRTVQGRRVATILAPLPDRDDVYLRAAFDESRLAQGSGSVLARFVMLILATSALPALFVYLRLRRFELVDIAARAHEPSPNHTTRQVAEFLLSATPFAALTVDRDNRILAANTLALELLNLRAEELETLHILKAALPQPLVDFYQSALKSPEKPLEAQLSLALRTPALTAQALFSPATAQWELALLTFR